MKQLIQKNQKKQNPKRFALGLLSCAGLALASLTASGCGPQAYVAVSSEMQQQAPGKFLIPPKVDILLVQDDTGSSKPIFGNISSQLNQFLGNLQNQRWDYHFATIPLTNYRALQQVQASKFDPNWGSQWLSPYPGSVPSLIAAVTQAAFRMPGEPNPYTDFLDGAHISSDLGGDEPGLHNLRRMLTDSSMTDTGFLRPDALLAIVLLSTGDDTSERNFCGGSYASNGSSGAASCDLIPYAQNGTRPNIPCGESRVINGVTYYANQSPFCNNAAPTLSVYRDFLTNFKGPGNSSLTRFYPVVSSTKHVSDGQCMGANAFAGGRYETLASQLGSRSFDICSMPIDTALTGIAANLASVELTFFTHFLLMSQEPNPATIHVYRNPGGDTSQRVEIPEDALNGWSFSGHQISDQFTISVGDANSPLVLNKASGWAVELHGSGIVGGVDTATVEFTPAGLQNSGG
jgi:hypothetical protein